MESWKVVYFEWNIILMITSKKPASLHLSLKIKYSLRDLNLSQSFPHQPVLSGLLGLVFRGEPTLRMNFCDMMRKVCVWGGIARIAGEISRK